MEQKNTPLESRINRVVQGIEKKRGLKGEFLPAGKYYERL
jgi:hypothetical protein